MTDSFASISTKESCSNENLPKLEESLRSYEVFRNNSTSVEVVVKAAKSCKSKMYSSKTLQDVSKLAEDNLHLKNELHKNQILLEMSKNGFNVIIADLRNQLEFLNTKELEANIKISEVKLENEKLKSVLDEKSLVIARLRKELASIRRTIKTIVKGLGTLNPPTDANSFNSDIDYDEFEKDLEKEVNLKNKYGTADLLKGSEYLFDSSASSKDMTDTILVDK